MTTIREMTIADHDAVMRLLRDIPGVGLRDSDSREGAERYLARNPGFSFVAQAGDRTVGCVMAGHDGRRGYLHHLAVAPSFRRSGVGRALVSRSIEGLAGAGIFKIHIDVFATNRDALAFWSRIGWHRRDDIARLSFISRGGANA